MEKRVNRTPLEWFWEKVSFFFEWWIKGWKRFFTIPLTLLAILCLFFPDWREAYSRSYDSISDFISPKTFVTRSELDVMNEWVISVWSYSDKTEAEEGYENFVNAWKLYDTTTWVKDIYLVRSCRAKKSWILVIDAGEGPQSEELANRSIKSITNRYNSSSISREKKNNLGQLLDDCYALYYDQKSFEYYNGEIINIHNKNLLNKK